MKDCKCPIPFLAFKLAHLKNTDRFLVPQVASLRVAAEESGSEDREASLVAREGCIWANLFVYAVDDARYQVDKPFCLWNRAVLIYREKICILVLDGGALGKSFLPLDCPLKKGMVILKVKRYSCSPTCPFHCLTERHNCRRVQFPAENYLPCKSIGCPGGKSDDY